LATSTYKKSNKPIEEIVMVNNLLNILLFCNCFSKDAHSFIKVRGSFTILSTSCKTGLDMAVVDINKNFLYNPVRPAFWEVDGT